MDSGSYIKEVTDYFHNEDILFFIRANNSETLLTQAVDAENWKACTINFQDMEVASFNFQFGKYTHRIIAYRFANTSFNFQFGKYTHRIIAYRFANKTGQISALTNDAKNYLFIITNDNEISEREAIIFYNKRGDSERVSWLLLTSFTNIFWEYSLM